MTLQVSARAESGPAIKVTKGNLSQLQTLLSDHAPIRSWRAVEFLLGEMKRATIVDENQTPPNVVTMHSRVEFRHDDSGATQIATLVYPGERDLYEDGISVVTPVGATLIGLAEGQSLSYPAPDGRPTSITVLRILYQPEAAARLALAGFPQRPKPADSAAPRIFDAYGHLMPAHHEQICKRLNAAGYWSPMQQSKLLAEQIGYFDDAEIWAILMWNARPSRPLASLLQYWIAAGMPVWRRAIAGAGAKAATAKAATAKANVEANAAAAHADEAAG
jgi:regulator of nucleoside diphosphate kinase